MHARDHAELAAHLALDGRRLAAQPHLIADQELAEFWRASRERQSAWRSALSRWNAEIRAEPFDSDVPWRNLQPVLDELVLSEPLVRVWGAISAAHDAFVGRSATVPIVHNVLLGQVDLRRQCWNTLAEEHGFPFGAASTLNMLWQRVQRWTDFLIARLPYCEQRAEWGFDAERIEDFADDWSLEAEVTIGTPAAQLLLRSLRTALRDGVTNVAAHPDLNRRIASSISSTFEWRESPPVELIRPLWSDRIDQQADHCLRLVNQLLGG